MKRILLVIFALISLNAFSQLQVKEGSFRYVPGGVIDDKAEYTDGNDLPMALIKISTENIPEQERMRLVFVGNRATQIIKKPKTGSMWIYISAESATFIDIRHPDYGTYKYYLPEELCDYCVYEMVLQYVPLVASANESVKPQNNFLTITCDQDNAAVYIDDEYVGDKDGFKSLPIGSTHTWRIECDLYHTESGSVTITEGQLIIDKTLRPAFGFLNVKSTPENGAIVYVNNKRVGETPYTSERLASGSYKVRVVKEMYKTSEQTFVVSDGKTTNAVLNMIANFVNVTINTDSQSDIYVDEELKGKGKWSGRLSEGAHLVEARKMSHTSTFKEVNLTAGMTEVINVESPKPIYGYLEISSDPILADIYIDGKHSGQTPKVIYDLLIGEHELKLSKQGCAEMKKTISIKEGETLVLNEKLQTGKEITITTDIILNNGEVSVQSLGESAPIKLKVVSASCSNNLAPQGNNTYGPWNMLDGNPATVWAVNLNDPSIRSYDGDQDCIYGPWFDVKCKKLSHIVIRNGYGKSTSSFINNSRASRVAFEIEVNGELEWFWFEFPLRDDPSPQHLNVPLNIEGNNNIISIQLVLDSRGGGIIKGEKWNDLCISEIEFWGWE